MIRSLCAVILLLIVSGAAHAAPEAEWLLYQKLYVDPVGRIVDTGNAGVSHSEGQGTGMLLAAHYRDRAAFDRIWSWTHNNLQVRDDHLLAWRWLPPASPAETAGSVPDRNNASDGDVLVAWALSRAARQWHEVAYREAALAICRDIRAKLIVHSDFGPLLLPGEAGFAKADGITVNLSYWIFPAFRDFAELDPSPEWANLVASGLQLTQNARFGRWQLPPDWLWLEAKAPQAPQIAPGFKPRFGYDAVRVPLYLVWAKLGGAQELRPFNDFWNYFDGASFVPAWTLLSDDSIDSRDATPGIHAVIALSAKHGAPLKRSRARRAPSLANGQDYYSASLLLLAKMAATESRAK